MSHRPPRHVLFMLCDKVNVLDVTGPLEVLSQPCRLQADAPPYRITVASLQGGLITTSAGLRLDTVPIASVDMRSVHTLILPGGGAGYVPFAPQALVDWISAHASSIARICSTCTGAFTLAATGLLAGRRVTTHWLAGANLLALDPSLQLEADALFVADGKFWTAAGVSAGIDLALALLESDLGHQTAMQVAQRLVVFLKRPGGQSQFSQALRQQSQEGALADLHGWMAANLQRELSVAQLAEQAGMSVRSFARHYQRKVGMTPAKAVAAMRLEAASQALAHSKRPLKAIAADCGFGDEQALRRAFQRQFGIAPASYRARFAA